MCGKPLRASFIQYKSVKQGYFSKGTLDEFELGNLCIGYLDHPVEKEAPGLSPLASFSWSGSPQVSIQEGNRSGLPEKTPGEGQQAIREGMHTLQERPVTDLFRHD